MTRFLSIHYHDSKGAFTMRNLLLIALVIFMDLPEFALALTCPNKPSNATTITTVHFNTSDGEGQLWEIYPGAGQIRQPSGVEGNATASILPVGSGTGGQQTIWPKSGAQQPLTNLYSCFRWKMNASFVGIREGNKLFFQAAQDFTYGRRGMNGVWYVNKRSSDYPYQQYQLLFSHNSGNLDNSHVCPFDLGLACLPNVADTMILPDTWYTIEVYTIASSCPTCRNATVKWWVNGALNGNYTNLNYGDGIVNQWQINHTWDNGEGKRCGPPTDPSNPRGRDCTYGDQIHYFDELLIAAVGGIPAGSGGGAGLDNPPGPPGTTTVTVTVQ